MTQAVKGIRADGSDDADGLENRPEGWKPPEPKVILRKAEKVEEKPVAEEPAAQVRGR